MLPGALAAWPHVRRCARAHNRAPAAMFPSVASLVSRTPGPRRVDGARRDHDAVQQTSVLPTPAVRGCGERRRGSAKTTPSTGTMRARWARSRTTTRATSMRRHRPPEGAQLKCGPQSLPSRVSPGPRPPSGASSRGAPRAATLKRHPAGGAHRAAPWSGAPRRRPGPLGRRRRPSGGLERRPPGGHAQEAPLGRRPRGNAHGAVPLGRRSSGGAPTLEREEWRQSTLAAGGPARLPPPQLVLASATAPRLSSCAGSVTPGWPPPRLHR